MIKSLRIKRPDMVRGPYARTWKKAAKSLENKKIHQIFRRAKRLIFVTDAKISLITQLGMTGKFLLSDTNGPVRKHNHLVMHLSSDIKLYFNDVRRFGKIWLIDSVGDDLEADMLAAGMSRIGPEPFDIKLPAFQRMLESARPVKSLLLDQTRLAGLGNIYADEALHAAGIHPTQHAITLSKTKAGKLLLEIVRVLQESIAQGGTTFSDYRDPYGDMGQFREMLTVYQRVGEPCRRCKTLIEKIVITGRSSHYCPKCQQSA